MEPQKAFSLALEYMLREKRMNEKDLAFQVGLSQASINRIKNGSQSSSAKRLNSISKVFGLTYEEMLSLGQRLNKGTITPPLPPDQTQEIDISEAAKHTPYETLPIINENDGETIHLGQKLIERLPNLQHALKAASSLADMGKDTKYIKDIIKESLE